MLVSFQLREYAKILRDLVESKATEVDIQATLDKQMVEIYRVVGICLGIPDEKFRWEYYDKSKAYQCIGPIKPTDFYHKYVKQCYNVDDKVSVQQRMRVHTEKNPIYLINFVSHFYLTPMFCRCALSPTHG